MEVRKGRPPKDKKEAEQVQSIPPPPVVKIPQVQTVTEAPKVKPTIVVKAQPITSSPQAVTRQSNQVVLMNTKTGKKTPMGRVQAYKWAGKYPNEFKVL